MTRATDPRLSSGTLSPGSLHLVCWTIYSGCRGTRLYRSTSLPVGVILNSSPDMDAPLVIDPEFREEASRSKIICSPSKSRYFPPNKRSPPTWALKVPSFRKVMVMAGLSTRCHSPTSTLCSTGVLREHDEHKASATTTSACPTVLMAGFIYPNRNTECLKRSCALSIVEHQRPGAGNRSAWNQNVIAGFAA
jgi:hypothetical protein